MDTTKKFNKLPSDAGVVFEGFEKITIESRRSVKEKLEDFINIVKFERKPAARVIIGEWGEGKTDAFYRYIKPKAEEIGYRAFFVSASTLSNSFELPDVKRLMNATPNSSLRFLVALFVSIKAESRMSDLPDPASFSDPNEFVEETIRRLRTYGEKLIVFIDEFEELLLNPDILKKIISGIKETINGQFNLIYEGGEFEGCLHFIIAATPDAFYKLEVSEETSLIFGGLGRRIGKIELPEIKRDEGLLFLWELLNYCFDYNLPEPLPIKSIGILNGIYRITRGNLGNMVSKFTKLMSRAAREVDDPDKMRIVDYLLFLDFFKGENIFVYGGSTPCIEISNYNKILDIVKDQKRVELGEKCANVLNLLLGECKPFSSYEIEKRTKVENAPNIINIINDNLQRLGIQKAILSVAKAKEGITVNGIRDRLSEFIVREKDKDVIRIDNYIETFDNFVDRITFYDISENKLIKEIYLPIDERSIISFFEGVSEDRAIEIRNKFRKLCSDEKYYIVSDELILQVFPTPVPKELEFIKDRELKLKLWRETTRNLAEQYRKHIPNALLTILEISEKFKIERIREERGVTFARVYIGDTGINILFFAVDGDLKGEDIDKIHSYIKGWKPPIHLVLALYTGEITKKAEEKIEEKELGKNGENIIMPVKLHPTLTKRIIIMHKMYVEYTDKLEWKLFRTESERIIQDIELDRKLENWLKDQESIGIVISDPKLEHVKSAKDLGDLLKFYINFIGEILTPKEAFDKNRGLGKFIKYGSKHGLFPDIESVKTLEERSIDLVNNGFLERESSIGRYKVVEHPVEGRILKLLELSKGKLDVMSLKDHFIITSSNRRILEDLFLNILEHKGKIVITKNTIELSSEKDLKNKLDLLYNNLRELDDKHKRYGFCFEKKKYDEKVIILDDFLDFAFKEYGELDRITDANVRLQRMLLLSELVNHFSETWLKAINEAKNEAEKIIRGIDEKLEKFRTKAEKVCNNFNIWLKIIIDLNYIKEYREIMKLNNKIKEIDNCSSYEGLKNIFEEYYKKYKGDEIFDHSREVSKYPYFNVKLFIVDSLVKEFSEILEKASSKLDGINKEFDKIDEDILKISQEIRSKEISKEYVLSSKLHDYLRNCLEVGNLMPSLEETKVHVETIDKLESIVKDYIEPIKENIYSIRKLVEYINDLYNEEKELLQGISKTRNSIDRAKEIFDLEEYISKVEEVEKNFNTIRYKLNSLTNEIFSSKEPKDPKEFLEYVTKKDLVGCLKNLTFEFTQIKDEIEEIWDEYKHKTLDYLKHLKKTISVIEKRHKELSSGFATLLGEIEVLEGRVDREFITMAIKLSEIENKKINIRNKFYELIRAVLNEEEIVILETIIKLSKSSEIIWVEKVLKSIEGKADPSKIDEILLKLVREGYLKLGVSLAV